MAFKEEDIHYVVHVKVEKVIKGLDISKGGCRCMGSCEHKTEKYRTITEVVNFSTSQPSLTRALDMGAAMLKLTSDVETIKAKESSGGNTISVPPVE